MLVCYSVNVVDLPHVSTTFRGHRHGDVIRRIYYKYIKTLYQYNILHFKNI